MRNTLTLVALIIGATVALAADGDTIHVRTIEFAAPQSGTFLFPPASVKYEKVLMNYTLRCPCGEWDYLEYVFLDEHRHNPDTTIRHQIMRYITPYGNGLNLGKGFTWTMDVSDFAPLFHDSVSLSAVNGQEQVELTFDLITGTPPRDVIAITPLWSGQPRYGFTPPIDSFLTPVTVRLTPQTRGVRLSVIQTGHGEDGHNGPCSEFCDNQQYISVGGTVRFSRHVWRPTCGLTPVYPQGGTWVYSRANWCPGAEVVPFDYELTPFATAGQPMTVQLSMDPYTVVAGTGGNSTPYYDISSHLIEYGAPHFQNDASVEQILAPTTRQLYQRNNPICGSPQLYIRNTGARDLTSVDIDYGVVGGGRATFHWNGRLAFMEGDTVHLPAFDWGTWTGPNVFDVTLSNPNGATDEYAPNNHARSEFTLPPVYYNDLEIHLTTNQQAAQQYEWWLVRGDGGTLAHHSQLADNTTYIDTFHLDDGCYEFRLVNYSDYGLSWWATQAQLGSGSLSFASKGSTIKTFNGDFGHEVFTQFRVAPMPTVAATDDTLRFGNIPVGGSKELSVTVYPTTVAGLTVSSSSLLLPRGQFAITSTTPSLQGGPVQLKQGDSMTFTVACTPTTPGQKTSSLSISTNDLRMETVRVALIGAGGSGSAVGDQPFEAPAAPSLSVAPDVITADGLVTFSGSSGHIHVDLVNVVGETVRPLFTGTAGVEPRTVRIDAAGLRSGLYFVAMTSASGTKTAPVVVVK